MGRRPNHRWGAVFAVIAVLAAGGLPVASAVSKDAVSPADDVAHGERKPVWLRSDDAAKAPMLAYPPREAGKKPLVVMLHGMCDAPDNECPAFAGSATSDRVLLCPRANLRCDGGGTIWSGKPELRVSLVNDAVARAGVAMNDTVDTSVKPTLIGFSLGSFVAVDVAQRAPGKYKNLILLGAKIEPDAKLLKAAGIESVVLGAGDRDMMKWHMVKVAADLQKKGVRATFMGMGDVGHWFAEDMNGWLTKAMSFLEKKDESTS